MKYSEIVDLFDNIKKILNIVEDHGIDNRSYILYLSNGDKLLYKSPLNSLPHLLGVNVDYLKSCGIVSSTMSAYDVLYKLIYEMGALNIYNKCKNGILDYKRLFSNFIYNKIDGLLINLKINVNETLFVCKYDARRSYQQGHNNEKYDYIVVKKLEDNKYGVLCLKENANCFVPMSNQVYNDYEELYSFLAENVSNQEVTILNNASYKKDFNAEIYNIRLNRNLYIIKLQYLANLKQDIKCIIDTSKDMEFYVGKASSNYGRYKEEEKEVESIIALIGNGQLITLNTGNMALQKVIDAYNSFIINKSGENLNDTQIKYSELISSLDSLKKEVERQASIIKEQQDKIVEDDKKINELEVKNRDLINTQEQIYKLVKTNEFK